MSINDDWTPLAAGDNDYVHSTNPPAPRRKKIRLTDLIIALLAVTVIALLALNAFRCAFFPKREASGRGDDGYYSYKDTTLYNQNGIWYEYDPALGWILADPSEDFLDDYNSYYDSSVFNGQNGASDFSGSDYFKSKEYDNNRAENKKSGINSDLNSFDNDADADNDWQ